MQQGQSAAAVQSALSQGQQQGQGQWPSALESGHQHEQQVQYEDFGEDFDGQEQDNYDYLQKQLQHVQSQVGQGGYSSQEETQSPFEPFEGFVPPQYAALQRQQQPQPQTDYYGRPLPVSAGHAQAHAQPQAQESGFHSALSEERGEGGGEGGGKRGGHGKMQ